MPIALNNIPTTNTTPWTLELRNAAGNVQATLAPGQASVLNFNFDRVRVITATLPHNTYVQNPNAAVNANPGNLGYLRRPANNGVGVVFSYAPPNGNAVAVSFQ